mmetsp:Transcript_16608/g.29084  ORF Transcript_16608/g.29084 Transcript_16608/m.29084 type:complete len:201 (-) Transcript_16608:204-806(-)
MHASRHNPDLALLRLDDAWAIWPNESRCTRLRQHALHAHHILLRNPLRDRHDQRDLCFDRLLNGRRSTRWWHKNHRRVCLCFLLGFHDRCEHRSFQMHRSRAFRIGATDDIGPILDHFRRVKRALFACESLYDHLGVLVDVWHRTCGCTEIDSVGSRLVQYGWDGSHCCRCVSWKNSRSHVDLACSFYTMREFFKRSKSA